MRRRLLSCAGCPQQLMEPVSPRDGSRYVSHYRYFVGALPKDLPIEDVVHFRFGLDPAKPAKGVSPLDSVRQEVFTDNEAGNFAGTVLKNLGFPGAILTPEHPFTGTDADLEAVKQQFRDSTTGENRGDVVMAKQKMQVHMPSWSPSELTFRDLQRTPEERISAVFNMPAIVAGLGAGLDRSTFANFQEAREMAYESGIVPIQRLIAADLTMQLLPEFPTLPRSRLEFDLRGVRVLQEDEAKKATRLTTLVRGSIITRAEARADLGLEVDMKRDDVYLVPVNVVEIGADGLPVGQLAEPEPVTTPALNGAT